MLIAWYLLGDFIKLLMNCYVVLLLHFHMHRLKLVSELGKFQSPLLLNSGIRKLKVIGLVTM